MHERCRPSDDLGERTAGAEQGGTRPDGDLAGGAGQPAIALAGGDRAGDQAQPYLLDGERVLAAFIARPKGAAMQNAVGGVVGNLVGGRKAVRQTRTAREAGLRLADPMALVLTSSRLLVLKISFPLAMGKGADVKELASEAPLSDVDSIEVKRLFTGKTVTVTVRGAAFMLEAGVGADPQGLAREFDGIRAGSAVDQAIALKG